jgi:hypothetical protein
VIFDTQLVQGDIEVTRYLIHHFVVLPNGNVIVSAYEHQQNLNRLDIDIASFSSNEVVADVLLEIERGPNNTANICLEMGMLESPLITRLREFSK